jgi:hypothetical protein
MAHDPLARDRLHRYFCDAVMSSVSVPCSRCNKPIGFRDRVCPACGAEVPRELRNALESRLEASDVDFRELKSKIRSAASVVLVLGALHICWGAFLFVVDRAATGPAYSEVDELVLSIIVVDVAIGAAMLGCFFWARRAPLPALIAGFGVWAGVHLLSMLVSPLTIFAGLLLKISCAILLTRGIVSAWQAASLMRRLSA